MRRKIISIMAAAVLGMAGIANAAPDSNSIVQDGIEYYIQTDKSVYHLGENVQMLYRVTNLGEVDVTFSFPSSPEWNFWVEKDEESIWTAVEGWWAFGTRFTLAPSEYKEFPVFDPPCIWDLRDDENNLIDAGEYEVIGGFDAGMAANYEYSRVSVPITILPPSATTYHVDAVNGSDDNDGLSKETAFATIQKAIDSAYNGDTVLVADGTYTGPGNRDIDFLGKAITVKSESGPDNCVIDCENSGRGFHFSSGEKANSIVQGFTITNGYASYADGGGGGIYCNGGSPTISNCVIIDNSTSYVGGGMCNYNSSSPTVTNCFFIDNKGGAGAGMGNYGYYNHSSRPTLTNCVFSGNYATGDGGGIRNISDSSVTLINCTFSENHAEITGGGLEDGGAYSPVTNCIFWGNTASHGSVQRQQITGYPVVNYNCIQGWTGTLGGIGNIGDDPCFVQPGYWDANGTPEEPSDDFWVEGDYHLLPDSLCIDAGDLNYIPEPNETDLDGNPRIAGGRIDMGAYESIIHEARLLILPRVLNRKSSKPRIMAWMRLPQGITRDQIDRDVALVLYPGGIKAMRQFVFQNRRRDAQRVSIFAFFDKAELMNALNTNGRVGLQVLGHLRQPGQYFSGTDTIRIKTRRLRSSLKAFPRARAAR